MGSLRVPVISARFALSQNFPNPLSSSTTIRYTVGIEQFWGEEEVTIPEVLSSTGGLVRRLLEETEAPGDCSAVWDGRDSGGVAVASGVYFYRLRVGEVQLTRKMLLVKDRP